MSPIEHYFENLLVRGSDIKGEPNKNALSKEVQEAIEICAYYIKSINAIPNDSNSEKVAMLEELKKSIEDKVYNVSAYSECLDCDVIDYEDANEIIMEKINALRGNEDDNC